MVRATSETEEGTDQVLRLVTGFRAVYVFDFSQTEGAELPEPAKPAGEVGGCRELLFGFLAQQGIEIEYNEAIAPAQGVSYGGRIGLLPGQAPAEEFATLIHETAHELLHRSERRATTSRTMRELEAESVAFVVGQAVGLEMGTTSADYIQIYNGNAAMLTASLEAIQKAAAALLSTLLPSPHCND